MPLIKKGDNTLIQKPLLATEPCFRVTVFLARQDYSVSMYSLFIEFSCISIVLGQDPNKAGEDNLTLRTAQEVLENLHRKVEQRDSDKWYCHHEGVFNMLKAFVKGVGWVASWRKWQTFAAIRSSICTTTFKVVELLI